MSLDEAYALKWTSPTGDFQLERAYLTEKLAPQIISLLERWCEQSSADDRVITELDACLKIFEWITSQVASSTSIHPFLIKCLIDTLPRFDEILLHRKRIHFKLTGLVWKGLVKVLSSQNDRTSLKDCSAILSECASRALKVPATGRSKDEEVKIRSFFVIQLNKLIACSLPGSESQLPLVCEAIIQLEKIDPGCSNSVIQTLTRTECLAGHIHKMISLFALHEDILVTFLQNADDLDILLQGISHLNQNSEVAISLLEELFCQKTISNATAIDILMTKCEDVATFGFVSTALISKRDIFQGSEWACSSLQGLIHLSARRWMDLASQEDEKLLLFCHIAWKIDPMAAVSTILGFGPFSTPLTLSDYARIQFMLCATESSWLIPLRTICKDLVVTTHECLRIGRLRTRHQKLLLEMKMECASVLGKCGLQNPEIISACLVCFDFLEPEIPLQAISANTRSILNTTTLRKVIHFINKCNSKISAACLAKFLSCLQASPCIQHCTEDTIANEIVHLFTESILRSGNCMLTKEEVFGRMADLLAATGVKKLGDLIPPNIKHEFLAFLKNERKSMVSVKRIKFEMPDDNSCIPMHPPALDDDDNKRHVDVADITEQVKRICNKMSLTQLHEFETRLLQVIQSEKVKRNNVE